MTRVLIDLTDLEAWSGNHGGIQRVVYGIAKEYYLGAQKTGLDVVFMTFSAADKAFYRTSFDSIYDRVEALKGAQETSTPNYRMSRKAKLKQKLRPYVPESLRRSESLRRGALKTYRVTVSSAAKARTIVQQRKPNRVVANAAEHVNFIASDTVLILGKPWDNLDIQRTLSREKQRVNFKLAQVVYDLIICLNPQLHHPSLFKTYTQHMFEAISASDVMLAISESSASDLRLLCKRLNLPVPEIVVIRLGDEIVQTVSERKPNDRIQDKFIACVGTVEIRKNHMLLYYAYRLANERGVELPQLVIIGSRGWLSGDLQYLIEHDPEMADKIIILDGINDAGLAWIYEHCEFTIYPSMYEGWGLPVAESLANGKFCIASSNSSVPEIAGSLIDYFSPYDSQQCFEMIARYAADPSVVRKKEQKIVQVYTVTTWNDSYEQIRNAL